jgi:hypothetical protein
VFTGRIVGRGQPEFLPEDTDGAIALAEEERDTCPSCGRPISICRSPDVAWTDIEVVEEECHFAMRTAAHTSSEKWQGKSDLSRSATVLGSRFRPGHEADPLMGLDLAEGE